MTTKQKPFDLRLTDVNKAFDASHAVLKTCHRRRRPCLFWARGHQGDQGGRVTERVTPVLTPVLPQDLLPHPPPVLLDSQITHFSCQCPPTSTSTPVVLVCCCPFATAVCLASAPEIPVCGRPLSGAALCVAFIQLLPECRDEAATRHLLPPGGG